MAEQDGVGAYERVADVAALENSGRIHVKVQGRYVSIIQYKDQLFCIDSTCYHAGGPLGIGDIEDVDGEPCIVCPWHHYLITLTEGSKLYQPLEMSAEKKLVPSKTWKKKEKAQRTHKVEIKDGGIYVLLSSKQNKLNDKYDSDEYGENALCGQQCMSGKESKTNAIAGADGKINGGFRGSKYVRSGQVFNQFRNSFSTSREKLSTGSGAAISRSDQSPHMNPSKFSGDPKHTMDETKTKVAEEKNSIAAQWETYVATCINESNGYHIRLPLAENEQLRIDFEKQCVSSDDALPLHAFRAYHLNLGVTNSNMEVITRPYTFVNNTVVDKLNIGTLTHLELYLRRYDNGEFTGNLKDNWSTLQVQRGIIVSTPEGFLEGCSWDQLDIAFLLAGGSGITPLLQIIRNILVCPYSKTKIMLLYFNNTRKSALALQLILDLARDSGNRLAVVLFFPETSGGDAIDTKYCSIKTGSRISTDLVKEQITEFVVEYDFNKAAMLWCGPPGFNKEAERVSLELGLNPDFVYGFQG